MLVHKALPLAQVHKAVPLAQLPLALVWQLAVLGRPPGNMVPITDMSITHVITGRPGTPPIVLDSAQLKHPEYSKHNPSI